MSDLPFAGLRIDERCATLAGRLVGLLFADQGADVRHAAPAHRAGAAADAYFDRGKRPLDPASDSAPADVVIVDGDAPVPHDPAQVVVRITAALPGDDAFAHLAPDCSEDLLSATLGFFTDMAILGPMLGRLVVYSPLPVSSVYTGVVTAVAVAAALTRRLKTGRGCTITAARLAGGLSAIGALAVTNAGLPPHLAPSRRAAVPAGMAPEDFRAMLADAARSDERQSWLEHRMIPFGSPYRAADGRSVIVINGVNRRATRALLQRFGLWDGLLADGLVDVSPYDPRSIDVRGRNLADSPTLDFASASKVAEKLEALIATRTAAEWEAAFCGIGVAAARVMSLQEWMHDPEARRAGLTVDGPNGAPPRIGRAAWIASADPYPPVGGPPAASAAAATRPGGETLDADRPLAGCVVVDLTNVIAGPNCARMLGELGATVYRVEHPEPSHPPIAMTIWAGEAGAAKSSLILDVATDDGRKVLDALLARADFVVANKSDAQCERMGIDAARLRQVNPRAILVQMTAHHGERHGARHDHPGYDPTGQAITGIMRRFGTERCPTYHGLASCVDYLCGYLGAWAATTALFARERRGDGLGDRAQTSLTAAASLMQSLFQFEEPPPSACGPRATGPSAGERVYRLADGWIFARAAADRSAALAGQTVDAALAGLRAEGIEAVRINTVRELADRHRGPSSTTIRFQARSHEGWATECFVPTWFCFDGRTPTARRGAVRIGSSADAVLAELGHDAVAIERMKRARIVLPVEWGAAETPSH